MKIIITGRNGYIANNLNKYLSEKGFHATQVSVREGAGDVDFSGCDVVIHCSAIVHRKEKNYTQQYYDKYNYSLTVELAEKAKKANVGHFVFISSMSVYGVLEGCIDKNTPLMPTTKYGVSKLKAEKALMDMKSENFRITIIRPPMVYGRGCPGNFGALSKLAGICPVFPLVENKKSMIYITNLCEAIFCVVEKRLVGIILPQDNEYVNTSTLFKTIAKEKGRRIYMSKFWGAVAMHININIFKKVFASLYYAREDCLPISKVDFVTGIAESIKK